MCLQCIYSTAVTRSKQSNIVYSLLCLLFIHSLSHGKTHTNLCKTLKYIEATEQRAIRMPQYMSIQDNWCQCQRKTEIFFSPVSIQLDFRSFHIDNDGFIAWESYSKNLRPSQLFMLYTQRFLCVIYSCVFTHDSSSIRFQMNIFAIFWNENRWLLCERSSIALNR